MDLCLNVTPYRDLFFFITFVTTQHYISYLYIYFSTHSLEYNLHQQDLFVYSFLVVGRIMAREDVHVVIPRNLCMLPCTWRKGPGTCDKVKGLELGRLSWIINVDPMQSQVSS